ncbi:U3 small nucleolar RNA-associated protein 15 homolog [Drosophila sulfurigaster albostrigata]|uniref:U3 small nucleolar RNA-associated protein 15 homolog n=1 Tax=Drosophila sulfurigaster albostrigata TaxID=89887 RepID=UPI002D21E151|nr:U3 small nucleolar RNA-associated protein 15 homolog [Drosophila sulfurigaster albostrigata]
MSHFQATNVRRFQQKAQVVTPDSIYWDRLGKEELLKEHSTIDYVDFSPSDPDNFVLTCSVRVQIYNLVTKLVVKNLSRFQKTAYGASFRQDGRLLAAGDEEGHVKLFDTTSRNILRLFKGHTAPVHRTFFTADKLQLASFADDKSVRLWDVANEKVVKTYDDVHTDYIRAGAMHPQASHLFVSGGYDGKINVYDTRTADAITSTLDHGSPVESMLFLPNGSIFITAGGTQVRVWDMISGCRLLTTMSQHHKTVTCLRLGSDGKRLFSGGLDRHVKIYDVSTYKTVHTITYPNAVVSLGVAAKDQAVVVGMVDGLVSIRRMVDDSSKSSQLTTNKFAQRRRQRLKQRMAPPNNTEPADHVVRHGRQRLAQQLFDKHLRQFNYIQALDAVLIPLYIDQQPEMVVALINELLHRKGLQQALVNRSEESTIRFIKFLSMHIGEVRYMRVLLNAASNVLDVFEKTNFGYSNNLFNALVELRRVMRAEIDLTTDLLQLKGALEMIIGGALDNNEATETKISYVQSKTTKMLPSKAAANYVVVVD